MTFRPFAAMLAALVLLAAPCALAQAATDTPVETAVPAPAPGAETPAATEVAPAPAPETAPGHAAAPAPSPEVPAGTSQTTTIVIGLIVLLLLIVLVILGTKKQE